MSLQAHVSACMQGPAGTCPAPLARGRDKPPPLQATHAEATPRKMPRRVTVLLCQASNSYTARPAAAHPAEELTVDPH